MSRNCHINNLLIVSLLLALFSTFSCSTMNRTKNDINASHNQNSWLKPGILTSERIKAKFGSFGVQVLLQDELSGVRLSNLYSDHDGEKITRTLALVTFDLSMDPDLYQAHQEILDGGSIGSTLTKYGFQLRKNALYKGLSKNMPIQLSTLMKSNNDGFATLIYDLVAKNDDKSMPYCTITEVYSPDFLTMNELNQLYETSAQSEREKRVDEQLAIVPTTGKVQDNLTLLKAAIGSL